MKIVSWNVNGIRAALKKGFKEFLYNELPTIICLQETKARPEQVELDLDLYKYRYWNSAEKKGYSGTAIFSQKEAISVSYGLGIEEHDKEGRIITAEFKDFYLVNVYTPNSKRGLLRLPYRKEWDSLFLQHLKKLEETKPVITCGDFNVARTEIDLANPKSNYDKNAGYTQIEIDGINNIINAGFIDSFRHFNKEPNNYTWWSYMFNARAKNIGWRIDYFLVSNSLKPKLKSAEILSEVLGSDHCPISIEINF